MRKRSCILYSCVLLLAVSCVESLPHAEGAASALLPVQLSFSLERAGYSTKADVGLTEMTEGFRGLEDIRLYALPSNDGTQALWPARQLPDITSTQASAAYSSSGYHNGIVQNNHAHLYPTDFASLPLGTKRAIVYGRAPCVKEGSTIITDKARNGSLNIVGMTGDNQDISAIAFRPDPIMTDDADGVAKNIADAMNYILGYDAVIRDGIPAYNYDVVRYTENGATVIWNSEIANEDLRNCFNEFTEHGQMMSGTGVYVEQKLTTLYRQIRGLLTVFSEGSSEESSLYEGLCEAILERFDNNYMHIDPNAPYSISLINDSRNYPINFGLPAGSAVLRWKGSVFDAVVRNDFDRIASIDHFCYMPRLYYYTNTTISTSRDDDIKQYYTSSNRYWTDILSHYDREKEVVLGTRAVALDNPLQYACSMMVATVRASSNQLPDSSGNNISLRNAYNTPCFPITGIIIGGQYEQDYTFTPKTGNDIEEYYLYDNQISEVFLTAVGADAAPEFRTLVLPPRETRDVYFYLEFRNDSDLSFTGADGLIVPGSYFYLSGKLDFPEEQQVDVPLTRIFTQDHATTVSCIVDSFENAFICVPEMETQQLRLGVKTSINWKMSTPHTFILD